MTRWSFKALSKYVLVLRNGVKVGRIRYSDDRWWHYSPDQGECTIQRCVIWREVADQIEKNLP